MIRQCFVDFFADDTITEKIADLFLDDFFANIFDALAIS
jgi:hypothetical protein